MLWASVSFLGQDGVPRCALVSISEYSGCRKDSSAFLWVLNWARPQGNPWHAEFPHALPNVQHVNNMISNSTSQSHQLLFLGDYWNQAHISLWSCILYMFTEDVKSGGLGAILPPFWSAHSQCLSELVIIPERRCVSRYNPIYTNINHGGHQSLCPCLEAVSTRYTFT